MPAKFKKVKFEKVFDFGAICGGEWLAGKCFGERASEKEIKEWFAKF